MKTRIFFFCFAFVYSHRTLGKKDTARSLKPYPNVNLNHSNDLYPNTTIAWPRAFPVRSLCVYLLDREQCMPKSSHLLIFTPLVAFCFVRCCWFFIMEYWSEGDDIMLILGDPGAVRGGEIKSKRQGKHFSTLSGLFRLFSTSVYTTKMASINHRTWRGCFL